MSSGRDRRAWALLAGLSFSAIGCGDPTILLPPPPVPDGTTSVLVVTARMSRSEVLLARAHEPWVGSFASPGETLEIYALFYAEEPAALGSPPSFKCQAVLARPIVYRAEATRDRARPWERVLSAPEWVLELLVPDRRSVCSPCRAWTVEHVAFPAAGNGTMAIDLGYPSGLIGIGDGQLFRVEIDPLRLMPVRPAGSPGWLDGTRIEGALYALTTSGEILRSDAGPEMLAPFRAISGGPYDMGALRQEPETRDLIVAVVDVAATETRGAIVRVGAGAEATLIDWTKPPADDNFIDLAVDPSLGVLAVGPPPLGPAPVIRIQGTRVTTEEIESDGQDINAITSSASVGAIAGSDDGKLYQRDGTWRPVEGASTAQIRLLLPLDQSLLIATDHRGLYEWFPGYPICEPTVLPSNFRRMTRFGPGILGVGTLQDSSDGLVNRAMFVRPAP